MENINNNLVNLSNAIDLAMSSESNKLTDNKSNTGLFTIKTASEWIQEAKNRPIPKMLFGEFWFEGEVCILFSDSNLGKSILAVQIGNSISRNEQIKGLNWKHLSNQFCILILSYQISNLKIDTQMNTQNIINLMIILFELK
jgi:RecA-family ATPase